MRIEQHRLQVRSSSPPVVEIDTQARAVYVRFKKAAVFKTVTQPGGTSLHIAVDLDRNGEVIGIEAVGSDEFGLEVILKKAKVDVPPALAARARYVTAKMALAGTTD